MIKQEIQYKKGMKTDEITKGATESNKTHLLFEESQIKESK